MNSIGFLENPSYEGTQFGFWALKPFPVPYMVLCFHGFLGFFCFMCLFKPVGRWDPVSGCYLLQKSKLAWKFVFLGSYGHKTQTWVFSKLTQRHAIQHLPHVIMEILKSSFWDESIASGLLQEVLRSCAQERWFKEPRLPLLGWLEMAPPSPGWDGTLQQPFGWALSDTAWLVTRAGEVLWLSRLLNTKGILSFFWKHSTQKTPGETFLCTDAWRGSCSPSTSQTSFSSRGFRPHLWCPLLPATTPCSGVKAPLSPAATGASICELWLSTSEIKAMSRLLLLLSLPILTSRLGSSPQCCRRGLAGSERCLSAPGCHPCATSRHPHLSLSNTKAAPTCRPGCTPALGCCQSGLFLFSPALLWKMPSHAGSFLHLWSLSSLSFSC